MTLLYPMLIDYWGAFYLWGQELWQGKYTALYPLPMMGYFALYTLLPGWVGGIITTLLSLAILVAITKRKAFVWLLYTPFLYLLTLGQVDMLFFGLASVGSPVALALMTLKPQLLILSLPRLIRFTPAQRKQFIIWVLVLYGPVTLLRPRWPLEWLYNLSHHPQSAAMQVASLWSQPLLLLLAIAVVALAYWRKRRLDYPKLLYAFHPYLWPYDYCLLIGQSLWLIPISWVLWLWWYYFYNLGITHMYMWNLMGFVAVLISPPPLKNPVSASSSPI